MNVLKPDRDLIAQEYVLVQAWKKTVSQIRYQNWFSDTLELDRAAADLPAFIARLSDRLGSGEYRTRPIALVPAPKSQDWDVRDGIWSPSNGNDGAKIRPLAHVSLPDQVAATAVMLCLSDRVETAQGDPRSDYYSKTERREVISFGNRLFCDTDQESKQLVHRWGSSKLYRAYFEDYRTFLNRPETVAEQLRDTGREVFIVQTDLKQFYDRVKPHELHDRVSKLYVDGDDDGFYGLARRVLSWDWKKADKPKFARYREKSGIPEFEGTGLPQGLIASGFFSNVVMLDFDSSLASQIGNEIVQGIWLEDICRYVDDIRITISTDQQMSPGEVEENVVRWLIDILDKSCSGMEISKDKTRTIGVDKEEQRLVYQSRKMNRIQSAISGGFDTSGGEEIIYAIEALVRSQANVMASNIEGSTLALKASSDVRDDTVGRFAAGRFRHTFRSLRPLLMVREASTGSSSGEISQSELDDEARSFSLMLIQRWISDPANVRLLRIGLDLWPSVDVLDEILSLMDPYISGENTSRDSKLIVYYCLGELLRAGATETGFVEKEEQLPRGLDISEYRAKLLDVATKLVTESKPSVPWYLFQQALMYIAVHNPLSLRFKIRPKTNDYYWKLIGFLQGDHEYLTNREFAVLAILIRRSFLSEKKAIELVSDSLTSGRFIEIASRDIAFAESLTSIAGNQVVNISSDIGELTNRSAYVGTDFKSLYDLVKAAGPENLLRNEIGILTFVIAFLDQASKVDVPPRLPPGIVGIRSKIEGKYRCVTEIEFGLSSKTKSHRSIYSVPKWVEPEKRWRFQLGYLLRFILTSEIEFSLPVKKTSWRENQSLYRPTRAHWLQRQYGFYNGHEAFGDNWLPISQFTQELMFALLAWPGCLPSAGFEENCSLKFVTEKVKEALNEAKNDLGEATGLLMLRVNTPQLAVDSEERPLRGCVVQSIMPEEGDFGPASIDPSIIDLEMSNPITRKKHQRHLSASLAAIQKMLELRQTHKPENGSLDWVIFPELSVHPEDVATYLIPFVRKYKATMLVGLGYERVLSGMPLWNSALWIIPTLVPGQGLQVIMRRQGKEHLSPMETPFNDPIKRVFGFRPCQWLIGFNWSKAANSVPLWLSSAVCYDATDLKLVSDLRGRSDVFAIPALNRDIGTFDQMAQALHYHMYQLVVVANNGTYGGSNAYIPKGGSTYMRQIFHTHGQPQAAISFFEINNISEMKERRRQGLEKLNDWKYPPAGY